MTVPLLVASLALQAIDNRDALPVFGDATLESGWTDLRALLLMKPNLRRSQRRPGRMLTHTREYCATPREAWARAVAAVALFSDWSDRMWPAAVRCRSALTRSTASAIALLHDLYRHQLIDRETLADLYNTSPLYGLIPTDPAVRLAGQRYR